MTLTKVEGGGSNLGFTIRGKKGEHARGGKEDGPRLIREHERRNF